MPTPHAAKILAVSGSLRAGSYNTTLMKVGAGMLRDLGATVTTLELREIPLPVFDEDLEKRDGLPAGARKLKNLLKSHGGLLIASPEYNSSVTAALKNAIDWASRPSLNDDGTPEKPMECFAGKVAGLVSASPGALGGLRGLVHLRAILGNIGVLVLPEQFALSKANEAFDEHGALKDARQTQTVAGIARRLIEVIGRLG